MDYTLSLLFSATVAMANFLLVSSSRKTARAYNLECTFFYERYRILCSRRTLTYARGAPQDVSVKPPLSAKQLPLPKLGRSPRSIVYRRGGWMCGVYIARDQHMLPVSRLGGVADGSVTKLF